MLFISCNDVEFTAGNYITVGIFLLLQLLSVIGAYYTLKSRIQKLETNQNNDREQVREVKEDIKSINNELKELNIYLRNNK